MKYDYDIVYVRTPRKDDKARSFCTEIAHPAIMDAGGDLMLLHPDGKEELLVEGGDDGSVTDPYVSFDGEWVFYSHIQGLKGTSQDGQPPMQGADIYKIHVKTRKIVRLTQQQFTPNTGAADWSKRLPHAGKGQDLSQLRRLQHGAVPAARRQAGLRQQPQRLSAAEASLAVPATVRHGRRRQQRRVDRPSEPRHGPASGRS